MPQERGMNGAPGDSLKAKAKYRGLSTAAAKCAAFGRDDVIILFLAKAKAKERAKGKRQPDGCLFSFEVGLV